MRPAPGAKPQLTVPERLLVRFGMAKQEPPYSQAAALRSIEIAKTYLSAREDGRAFEYSGGKTFLNGYPVNNPSGAGLIDCSTYLFLILLQIPYARSPYADNGCRNYDPAQLPAAAQQELLTGKDGKPVRFAADLGYYFYKKGLCFHDRDRVRPGDLTFHCGTVKHSKRWMNVTHIGIVAEDGEHFYNVTSIPKKVVVSSLLSERSDLVFFARPDYEDRSEVHSAAEISKK